GNISRSRASTLKRVDDLQGGFVLSLYALFAVFVILPPAGQEIPPITLEDRVLMPCVELLEPAKYVHEEFEILRSRIEHDRDEKIETSRKEEKQWKIELDAARAELEELNKGSS